MDLPIDAEVYASDGVVGNTIRIVLNPVSNEVTHIVVKPPGAFEGEYMVPLEQVAKSSPEAIYLNMTRNEFATLERYSDLRFIDIEEYGTALTEPEDIPAADVCYWPYFTAEGHLGTYADTTAVPHDELAIHRGAQVEAANGRIGRVDEFLVDEESHHISHLVLREGHLWGKKDVTVPVAEIDHIEADTVYLKLSKKEVEALPSVKVRR